MKSLVIYCYLESEQTKDNLTFFLRNGVFDSDKYHYEFIINNLQCSVEFPPYQNINVHRRNENSFDFYTYKWFIEKMGDEYFSDYSRIYFINSSCIGPFMSVACSPNWIDNFNDLLIDYQLVGPVIEIPDDNLGLLALGINSTKNIPFIHTYMFGVNQVGFSIINNVFKTITSNDCNKLEAIYNIERQITSAILMNEGKVKSLLVRFKHIDLNKEENWDFRKWNTPNTPSCYEVPKNYFKMDLNPFEIVFIKNIRNENEARPKERSGISSELSLCLNNYSQWS